jgi:type I restriction enzyme M protein
VGMALEPQPKRQKTLEARLWEAADALRGNQEPSEYKHVVLGLVFLKYISDRFESRRADLEASLADPSSEDFIPNELRRSQFIEDRDEYTSHNVFWVPADARWAAVQAKAKLPSIGQDIDRAMDLIEKENSVIRGVLPRNYGREGLDKGRLGQLVDLIGSIGFTESDDHGSDDVLGRVYEYFLGQFAGKETGKDAGAFYTPRWVVRLLVEMLEPYHGRVYDPAAGSGGMFVESSKFVNAHGGKRTDISVYGQEFTDATWRLARMNLALRGIEADLGDRSADSFTQDLHPDLRADFVIANPPFNVSNWWDPKLAADPRWKYGTPPEGNANFAWVQHFIHHLAPDGTAGFVLANGSLSSKSGGEGEIRRRLIEEDLVDCIVSLPDKLFLSTAIPVSLWFVSKGRRGNRHRKRDGEILFIDARDLGSMYTRKHRELTESEILRISDTYHAWRNKDSAVEYEDVPGFAKAARIEEVAEQDFVLTPSRYVGILDRRGLDPLSSGAVALRGETKSRAARLLDSYGSLISASHQALEELDTATDIRDWAEVRVGDVAQVVGGGTPPSRDPLNFGGEIPWITPKDLTSHEGRYVHAGTRSLTAQGLASSSARLIAKDSVLISSRAPIGLVAIAGQPLATNQGVRSLTFDETQDPVFWYYLLKSSTSMLDAHANGSTFREISGGSIGALVFKVPPLHVQRKLSATLGQLDSITEHNLRMNVVLDEVREQSIQKVLSGIR